MMRGIIEIAFKFLISDHVNSWDKNGKPYLSSLFILLAIFKKVQNVTDFDKWEQSLPDASDVSADILGHVKYYAEFACNVYQTRAHRESQIGDIAETMTVAEEDVIVSEIQDDEGEGIVPKFVFLVDHKSKSIILTVRGTKTLKDTLFDMVCDDAPFLGGSAHTGMVKGARRVWDLVAASVEDTFNNHPGYDLVLTG